MIKTFCQQLLEIGGLSLDDMVSLVKGNVHFTIDEFLEANITQDIMDELYNEIGDDIFKGKDFIKLIDRMDYSEALKAKIAILFIFCFVGKLPPEAVFAKIKGNHGLLIKDGKAFFL